MKASDILDRFGKLPRTQRLLLYGVLYVLVLAGFWFLLFSPAREDLARYEKEQTELKTQLNQVRLRAANKDALEAEAQQLLADLEQALKELPEDREIPGLLKGISSLGRKVGLDVKKFQPMAEKSRDYVAEVPVNVELTGSYHEVAMFFDRLSKMNRIVYVQNLEMKTPVDKGGRVTLTVTGQAVTFRFLSDAEIAAQAAAKEAAKKGKGRKN